MLVMPMSRVPPLKGRCDPSHVLHIVKQILTSELEGKWSHRENFEVEGRPDFYDSNEPSLVELAPPKVKLHPLLGVNLK